MSKSSATKGVSKARAGVTAKGSTLSKGVVAVKTGVEKPRGKTAARATKSDPVTTAALPKASKAKPATDKAAKTKTSPVKVAASAASRVEPANDIAPQVNATQTAKVSGLNVGDVVPVFDALDQAGQTVSNRDWTGAPYVLYFYPKDDTPGCTTEACGFRDELPSFAELGVKVVGCSPDSPNAHTRFATKYGLQFTLLADIEKDLAQLFGVWKLKQNYGREYMGVERSTFLIDKSGKVARQWRGVRVAGHVSEVLSAVRDLP